MNPIKKDSTSVSVDLFIADSSVTTGAGKTGLAFNTASLVAYYHRPGATATAITLATQTVAGAFSSGGFVEIDATNMPGLYRLDVPNAALATGVDFVTIMLKGAANMAPVVARIPLFTNDPQLISTVTTAQVNAEVLDVLATDTFAEAASVPAGTSTLKDKINWLFALSRNKVTQTATTQTLRNDADSGNIATSTHSDDAVTHTRGEWA